MAAHIEFDSNQAPAEAIAFVRGILSHPEDRLRRLVFSDWLEERGGDSNTAWAGYLRTQAALQTEMKRSEQEKLQKISKSLERSIRARLRFNLIDTAANFVVLPRLLPTANMTIHLGDASIDTRVIELFPESVAREKFLMPFGLSSCGCLAIAAARPSEDLRAKLSFILNREVIFFTAEMSDINQSIDMNYGVSDDLVEMESITCVSYESPLIGAGELFGLFHFCFEGGFDGMTFQLSGQYASVDYFNDFELKLGTPITKDGYNLLLKHLQGLEPIEAGEKRQLLNLPLLSGRDCPIRIEKKWHGKWLRVTFVRDHES